MPPHGAAGAYAPSGPLTPAATTVEPSAHADTDRRPVARRPVSPTAGSSRLQTLVLFVMAIALIGGVAATVYFQKFHKKSQVNDPTTDLRDRNLSFEPPGAPWVQDDNMRAKLGSPIFLVYKQENPEAYMAFGAKDFESRLPRPSELRDGLMKPLNNLFHDIQQEPSSDAKWLGQPALYFAFRARRKDEGPNVAGQCHAVAYKGIAYWSICWTGENDAEKLKGTFEASRGRFQLLDQRKDWRPREATVRPFGGHRLPYQVLDAEGIWSEPDRSIEKPEDVDPKGDLLLRAKQKRAGRDFADEAILVALILDEATGDPLAVARQYVEDQRRAEVKQKSPDGGFEVKFTELTGDPAGDPAVNPIDGLIPVVRLASSIPQDRNQSRLIVVSAIRMGDRIIAVMAWCPWADREVFEAKLMQIAGSLREAK
jgi:hypothetical protein